ncbi:MAG: alpha-galactosidase [Anaerolineae bacterium]
MSEQEICIRDQLVLQPSIGLVKFVHQGKVLLDRATAKLVYIGANGQKKSLALAGYAVSYGLAQDSISLSVANSEVQLTWQLWIGEEIRLNLEVKNMSSQTIRIVELYVLDVDAQHGGSLNFTSPPRNWRCYQNGWQSWTPTFARQVANGLWIDPNTDDYRTKHQPHALLQAGKTISSEWFTIIVPTAESMAPLTKMTTQRSAGTLSDPSLLLGFITTADQLAELRLELSDSYQFQRLEAIAYADGFPLAPGAKLCSEMLLFTTSADPLRLMDLYATRLGEAMHAKTASNIPTGWCTWYYFFGEDTAEDVLANLNWIEKRHLPLDVILIDDGYETAIGDWLDVNSAKYPQGMQHIAEQIAATGHRPGIWTAPFAASSASKLYAEHPDWVLRNEQGEPIVAWQHWGVDIYGLDLSLPAVQDWLRDLFHTLSVDWGFRFFKVDFLYAAALPGVRHNDRITRAQAVRRGLEIIRSAIGDSFLLGCGAPLGPSVGMVDAMRIGPDVHVDWQPFWQDLSAPSAANAILNAITRSFLHGKLWLNDPDCLVLRPRGDDSNLVLNEMRALTTIVGLSGGLVLSSDNLPTIRRGRPKYLQRILPPYGRSALPLDLFHNERPRLLVLPIESSWDSWVIVALLNWDDHSCITKLDLAQLGLPSGAYHVYNYWRQRYLDVTQKQVVIDPHQPHEMVLLLLKPVSDQPQLLTSTFHILQGAVEVKSIYTSPNRLVVDLEKPGRQFGRLVFAVPGERVVSKVLVNGRPQRPRQIAVGIWQAGFLLNERATVELLLD